MADESASKPDWAITFLGRLCLIGWTCAILFETFYFLRPVRQICLLVGPWACIIALLNALWFLYARKQGIFLIFVLVAALPAIHFGLILKNIAVENKWVDPAALGSPASGEPPSDAKNATAAEN